MKFIFKKQQYQTNAVDAVVNCFDGQKPITNVQYLKDKGLVLEDQKIGVQSKLFDDGVEDDEELEQSETGYRNADIILSEKELLDNIHKVQDENFINQSESIMYTADRPSLDVEMETGTGKTYVYTKTMFELNKKYGWSKFIIVVPSIAIREGVAKSIEYTQDHFMQDYGKKLRYFIYNSKRLNMLDQYSSSADINVMIINTQAFNRTFKPGTTKGDSLIIYTKRDEFASRRPIDVIAANRPILILDEPQKMGREESATQQSLKQFKPLFVLNYSATHKEKHNLVYRLDALDAFNQKLVKKIEVKGFKLENIAGTHRYIYVDSIILSQNKPPIAKLEIEVKQNGGIKRLPVRLNQGDKLDEASKGLAEYKGVYIAEIIPDHEHPAVRFNVEVSNNSDPNMLYVGEMSGNVAEKDIRRVQIRETIRSHFDKEKEFFNEGKRIKVLSLFFIDEVAKYREYDADGNPLLGEYGVMFEQEYLSVLNEYRDLFPGYYKDYLEATANNIRACHEGYFSIDKKGRFINSTGDKDEDISTYDAILRDKALLLGFDMPLRFIFSHSALREGWDNPNVFQICTLKHSDNNISRRQEVGRGMRLCVNEEGTRQDFETLADSVHDVNTLTVIASESYKDFVDGLQKDISNDLSDSRPKFADIDYFKGRTFLICGKPFTIDKKQANIIHNYLYTNNYIDDDDKVTAEYKKGIEEGTIQELGANFTATLPEEYQKDSQIIQEIFNNIHKLVQSVYNPSALDGMITSGQGAKWEEGNPLNDNFAKKEFQELWNKINHKYSYTCHFNSEELIKNAVAAIKNDLHVVPMRYTLEIGKQKDEMNEVDVKTGTSFGDSKTQTKSLSRAVSSSVKYDLVGDIAKGCKLTRKTIATILSQLTVKEMEQFGFNPEKFIRDVTNIINAQKSTKIVEHIEYHELSETYDSSIFTAGKLPDRKPFESEKAIQNLIFTDGSGTDSIEWRFASDLEAADEVVVYAKLPRSFQIPTPVGNYAPDWAIAFDKDKVKHIFFVAETKGSLEDMQLRKIEANKIACAKKLFNEVSTQGVKYDHVDSYESLKNIIGLKG